MASNKSIRPERLPENARIALLDFYEFLVRKYVKSFNSAKAGALAKEKFFQKVASRSFSLPADYTFDRDEIHER